MRNFHSSTLVKATIITGVQAAHELDGSVIVETEDGLMQVSAALTAPRVPNVGDIVVMELDSWALHGLGEIKKSPHVAVFTNFLKDLLTLDEPAAIRLLDADG